MKTQIQVRPETPADTTAITEITQEAFRTLEVSNQTEHYIIEALRAAGALTISLVAEREGRVVGHIAFSPITISDGTPGWFGLGPVSVLPELQRQKIGTALINKGLEQLKALGAAGCCVVGHPEYYRRFGFKNPEGLELVGVPQEVFFALPFGGDEPRGQVSFHAAFAQTGPVSDPQVAG